MVETPKSAPDANMGRLLLWRDMPDDALLSVREIGALAGRSRSSVWRDVKEGYLPQPVRVGPKSARWRIKDVRRYMGVASSTRLSKGEAQ